MGCSPVETVGPSLSRFGTCKMGTRQRCLWVKLNEAALIPTRSFMRVLEAVDDGRLNNALFVGGQFVKSAPFGFA